MYFCLHTTSSFSIFFFGLELTKYLSIICRVHVRRTDKIKAEAAYHSLEEYMYWVDLYYKKLSLTQKVHQKNVYLASDDHTVLPQAKKK